MRNILFILLLVSTSVFAQTEHGILFGGGVGFPMQDGAVYSTKPHNGYNYEAKVNGMFGYRVRFLSGRKTFFDLDATMGVQRMPVYEYQAVLLGDVNRKPEGESVIPPGESFTEFFMPISVTPVWNYRLSDKFHVGLGLAPTLYLLPQVVFDLSVMAKVGYRICEHCELGLSYQYGCLNTLKHFNDGPALGRRGHFSDLMLSVYIPFSVK